MIGDQIYDLYGVVIHVGSSTNSGHYYAYCKNMQNNAWYQCNDSHISSLASESGALNKEAYMLFYQKRYIPAPEPKLKVKKLPQEYEVEESKISTTCSKPSSKSKPAMEEV